MSNTHFYQQHTLENVALLSAFTAHLEPQRAAQVIVRWWNNNLPQVVPCGGAPHYPETPEFLGELAFLIGLTRQENPFIPIIPDKMAPDSLCVACHNCAQLFTIEL